MGRVTGEKVFVTSDLVCHSQIPKIETVEYNGGFGGILPPDGGLGAEPPMGVQGAKPPASYRSN